MKDYLKLRKEELKKRGAKGFTLMEMLIVVAIIAVLIAIAIPIFSSQLENSREATDAANLRNAYATASAALLTSDGSKTGISAGPVAMQQSNKDGWQNDGLKTQTIGNVSLPSGPIADAYYVNVDADGNATITADPAYTPAVDPTTGKTSQP
jgi:type IV pilus assembly protein PilA